jgi:hypothetical protein
MLLSKRIIGIAAAFALASSLATTGRASAELGNGTQVEFSGVIPPNPTQYALQMGTYVLIMASATV